MSWDREILASQEQSTPVSTWTEHLCLSSASDGVGRVEICGNVVLGEQAFDDEGEPLELPDEIDGCAVMTAEDGYIIGWDLVPCDDEATFTYTAETVGEAMDWIGSKGFKDVPGLRERLERSTASAIPSGSQGPAEPASRLDPPDC